LQKIKRDEGYRQLSLGRKRQLFEKVAYDTFSQDEYFIPQNQLIKHIVAFFKTLPPADEDAQDNGEQVLKTIEARHGIFTERAHRIYSFAHLTFQEYFTAKYLIEEKQRVVDLVTQHFDDYRWREVFLLVVSGLDNADVFFQSFKQAMDNLIKQDKELVALLQWVDKKANSVKTTHKIGVVRSFYLFFALKFAYVLGHDIRQLLVIARSSEFITHDLEILALELERSRDLEFFSTLTLVSHELNNDIHIDHLLHIALQISLIFKEISYYNNVARSKIPKFKPFFSEVINHCDSLPSLSQALCSLVVPNKQTKQKNKWKILVTDEWRAFSENLRIVMQRERNVGYEWNLNERQIETLNKYLQANLLMLECLKLAAVSDRKAIEDSVLLPPVV